MNWKQLAGQDVEVLTSRIARSLDSRMGVAGRRIAGGVLLAASLASASLLYMQSKPIEAVYTIEHVAYTITDTVAVKPRTHIVRPGESLWKIVATSGEPAAVTAARVNEVCNSNPQLKHVDALSVRHGRTYHAPDGISCDYLPVGAVLSLPMQPTIVQRPHEATVYQQQTAGRPYATSGLFLATLCMAAAYGAAAIIVKKRARIAPLPPLEIDPHVKYRPATISI
jgi:hypothetical protein